MTNSMPQIAPVRQTVTDQTIHDIPAHLHKSLNDLPISAQIQSGMKIAVGVGSRGISSIREVVTTVVQELQRAGAEPYLVPAMGSHGGGNAEGQRDVLIGYGLGEDVLGVPIRSSMETIEIGKTADGLPVYFDVNAAQADGIVVINRIKPHTAFRNAWESGLFKMLAVGFGKPKGAATIHARGVRDAMPASARVAIERMPVLFGVGIVENGHHHPAHIEVVPAHKIESREPHLLQMAWNHLPRIPFDSLDILILQEIGKDISGTGMDLNVVGMWRRLGGEIEPDYRVIAALDLTPNSHGNAVGIGYCDAIPQRLRDKIDIEATYMNCLTAGNYNGAKIPITLPTDKETIMVGLQGQDPNTIRLVIARNTLDLETLWVSEVLLPEVNQSSRLEQIGELRPLPLNKQGQMCLYSG